MSSYVAPTGQEITEDMIDRWCEAYERGEFPAGEHTVGDVVVGRPPLSAEKTVTLTVKVPIGMKAALVAKAKQKGKTASGYTRDIIAKDLLATS